MEYIFSQHALEQMRLRGISKTLVESILKKPDQRKEVDDLTVLQGIRTEETGEFFLVRVFINEKRDPNVIVTVYKTSKIQKYYESEI
jgi:hypothetical protein